MTNESVVLSLDIGGNSDDAKSAADQLADALSRLIEVTREAGDAGASLEAPYTSAGVAAEGAGEKTRAAGEDAQGAAGAFGEFSSNLADVSTQALGSVDALEPLANAAEIVKEGFSSAAEQITKLGGDSGDSAESLDEVKSAASGAGSAAAGAAQNFGQMGASATSTLGTLALLGGSVGVAAIGTITSLGTHAAEWGSELEHLSILTDMDIGKTQLWSLALQDAGGSSSTLQRIVPLLTKELAAASAELDAGDMKFSAHTQTLLALGIQVQDTDGKMRGFGDVFPELMTKLAGMEDRTQRNEIAFDLFGKKVGVDAVLLLDQFGPAMAAANKQVDESGDAAVKAAGFAGEYHTAMVDLETQVNRVSVVALPVFVDILKGTNDWLGRVINRTDDWGRSLDSIGIKVPHISSILSVLWNSSPAGALSNALFGSSGNGSNDKDPTEGFAPGAFGPPVPAGLGFSDALAKVQAAMAAAEQARKDEAAAIRSGNSALKDAEAEQARYTEALKKAASDGVITLTEATELKLTPAMAATEELTGKLALAHADEAQAAYRAAVNEAELIVALNQSADSAKTYQEFLAKDLLDAATTALSGLLGQNTKEGSALGLAKAEINEQIANFKNMGASDVTLKPLQAQADAINRAIAVENSHIEVLKAEGVYANAKNITDKQQDQVAHELIGDIQTSSTVLSAFDDHVLNRTVPSLSRAEQAADTLASALLRAAQVAGNGATTSSSRMAGDATSLALAQRGG